MLEKPIARTKILATLGPACASLAKVKSMIQAGVTAFRLNMSHGADEDRLEYIGYVKAARKELKRSVAILVDLRGPRIRLGKFSGLRTLVKGDKMTLKVTKSSADTNILPIDYKNFAKDVVPEQRVLIRDGRIALVVDKVIDDKTVTTAAFGGFAANAAGVTDDTTTFIATASGTIAANVVHEAGQHLVVAASAGKADTDTLTAKVEAVQAVVNTARVQAGSQYAAIESAVNYTTDLTAQYELGFNTVNDVNFSMETAHLAKNQILQQAATAMLAQANMGQQSLLQLIQG